MRVVHYFHRLDEASGGVPRAIYDLLYLLSSGRADVTLITALRSTFPLGWRQRITEQGGRVVLVDTIDHAGGFLPPASLGRIRAEFHGADLLHFHGTWRPSGTQVCRLARKLEKPYVLTPHGTLNTWSMRRSRLRKRLYYRLFERANLSAAGRIHATAESEAVQSRQWIGHNRVTVIPCALDLRPFRDFAPIDDLLIEHPEIARDRVRVLFLGRLHPSKGIETAIEATALLQSRGRDVQLVIAGPAEIPSYAQRLRRMAAHLVPDTAFLGLVTGPTKFALYQAADALILPTRQENFGLVIPEALASGTPVVTTRGAGSWQDLSEGGGVRIVDDTAPAFAEELERLLADPERAAAFGAAGREWVCSWLDPDGLRSAYLRMYEDAIRDGSRNG